MQISLLDPNLLLPSASQSVLDESHAQLIWIYQQLFSNLHELLLPLPLLFCKGKHACKHFSCSRVYWCSKPNGWFAYVTVNNISLHSTINFSFYLKNIFISSTISGFRRQVAEKCAVQCYYATSSGKKIIITRCIITHNGVVLNIFKTQLMDIIFFPTYMLKALWWMPMATPPT